MIDLLMTIRRWSVRGYKIRFLRLALCRVQRVPPQLTRETRRVRGRVFHSQLYHQQYGQ
jgi:hypothetical protein